MNGVTTRFLDWSRPALDQAADFLTQGWKEGPLDLRDSLIVVPTRHAGRRLRERLASTAAERDSAVLMGAVETPATLFAPKPGRPLTDPLSTQALWQRALSVARQGTLDALFPVRYPDQSAARASNAEHIARLRALLSEEGHTFTSFARAFGDKNPEPERWACLAGLEMEYMRQVESAGLQDDSTAKIAAAHRPESPASVRRVIVLFVPDPPPLAITALDTLSTKLPVTVCVHAPESASDRFDTWGRPLPDRWERTERPLRNEDIERCDDAAAMVEHIRRRVHDVPPSRRRDLTVGVATPDTAAQLRLVLERDGIPAFDPSGAPAANLPLFRIVRTFLELHADPSFSSFVALARLPDVLRRLEKIASAPDLLELLDEFQRVHIPASCSDAWALAGKSKRWAAVASALNEIDEWIRSTDAQPLAVALPGVLSRVYEGRQASEELASAAQALNELLDRFARIETLCDSRPAALALFLRAVESLQQPADRPPEAVDLLGWLELAWEDAPALLLADLNDGLIPEAVTGDPFLPDRTRQIMGLRDNRMRLARDAHTLESILRSRPRDSVRLFVPRRNQRGDPLKPSRLLFQCADSELAARAMHLMSDTPSPFAMSERATGWRLSPPLPDTLEPVTTVSATGLRTYLACPFMYYMKQVLRMDPIEPAAELDAMGFGSVAHEALEAFAHSEFRDTSEAPLIEQFLQGAIHRIFRDRHGDSLPLPLRVQRDVLLQRMSYVALTQSALRAEGWRILDGEQKFEMPLGHLTLHGRIDRIDRHEDGRLRVIDYKTSRDPSGPASQHLKKVTARTLAQPWALTADGGARWVDLQLPLYCRWCETQHANRKSRVECAYFVIPDAVTETAVSPWLDLNEDMMQDAWQCAGRIATRIAAGLFWPPQTSPADDDPFHRVFFEDIVRHLDPAFVNAMEKRQGATA